VRFGAKVAKAVPNLFTFLSSRAAHWRDNGPGCQGSAQPVCVSEAPRHGADQQLSRVHAAARRHIAQDSAWDQEQGRDGVVRYADDVLPDMGAERGKRVRGNRSSRMKEFVKNESS